MWVVPESEIAGLQDLATAKAALEIAKEKGIAQHVAI